jgi:hypothetical protein
MTTETQTSQNRSRIWQWLVIILVILLSFTCVFFSAQGALMSDQERVINANMLADSRISYHLDPKDDIPFAPLDARVIVEATQDAGELEKTPAPQSKESTPVSVAELPDTSTPQPTKTPIKNPPTKTSKGAATNVPPSETPIPPTETEIPPTHTPIPATVSPTTTAELTDTATNPPPAPTRTPTEKPTKKPKKPTKTPIPPTPTPIPTQTPTGTFTDTPQPTFTVTFTPSPTNTPVSSPTDTLVPSPTNTSSPTPTDTPITPPTDTPVPVPTDTPTPVYRNVRPLLTCVRDNGDGTFTAYFGYRNPNANTVNIPYGNRNRVIPGIIVSGQPEDFSPGQHDSVFSVDFQIGAMWILDGRIRIAPPGDTCP